MPQNRFLVQDTLTVGKEISLSKDDLHYFRKVLRNTAHDEIEIINGKGFFAKAEVIKAAKETVVAKITTVTKADPDPFQITLALALLKPAHLEYALEKATEVGASNFLLFNGDRSEKKEVSNAYYKRLTTIVEGATKQCGRLYIPQISIRHDLGACLEEKKAYLYGDFGSHAKNISEVTLTDNNEYIFIIGPEAGLSDREKKLLQKLLQEKKAQALNLHPNILRAETAAVAAVLLLHFKLLFNSSVT